VEDKIERGVRAILVDDRVPKGSEDLGPELRVRIRIDAVDVSEGRCKQVSAVLAAPEPFDDLDRLLGCAVQPRVGDAAGVEAALLAADNADLDLEDDVRLAACRQQLARRLQVLVQRQRRAVEHVRLEDRRLLALDTAE